MINKRIGKILLIQMAVGFLLILTSFFVFKFGELSKSDSYFSLKYFLLILLYFIVSLWPILLFSNPILEEIENEKSKKEKSVNTERESFEIENRLYNLILNYMEDPLLVISDDLNAYYYNNKLQQLFNLKESSFEIPLIEITRNFNFQTFVQDSVQNSKKTTLETFTFDNGNSANQRFFDIYFIPIKFSNKNLIVLRDVSEIKLTNQIREDFISNFSHEIRTPLTILHGQIQGLKQQIGSNDESLNNSLTKIEKNSKRLNNLFDDLLNLALVEKKKDLSFEEIDLEPLIENITQDLKLKYPHKKIDLKMSLNVGTIKADYNLFELVIINMLDNAIKYSRDENCQIKIETNKIENYHTLSIEDNGIGIPESSINRIFERFYRVDQSRCSEIAGTGLGLSIVKHILNKHCGKIKVQAQINKGTTFTFFFPH